MKIIFVSIDGSDLTGDGTYGLPYQTIERALTVFSDGDQVRLMDGTYTPIDSISLTNVQGSILAENPATVTIRPTQVTASHAVIDIKNSPRFFIGGLNILQASNRNGNTIGILGSEVDNFIVHTCSVSGFEVPSAYVPTAGIMVSGSGRIESCDIHDLAASQDDLFGIFTDGRTDVVDCTVYALSGTGTCNVHPIKNGHWTFGYSL